MDTPTPPGTRTPRPRPEATSPVDDPYILSEPQMLAIINAAGLPLQAPVRFTFTYTPGPIAPEAILGPAPAPASAPVPDPNPNPSTSTDPVQEFTTLLDAPVPFSTRHERANQIAIPVPGLIANLPTTVQRTYTLSTILYLVTHSPEITSCLDALHLTNLISVTAVVRSEDRTRWRVYTPTLVGADEVPPDVFVLASGASWEMENANTEKWSPIVWEVEEDHDDGGRRRRVSDERVWWEWAGSRLVPTQQLEDAGRSAEIIVQMGGPRYGDEAGLRLQFDGRDYGVEQMEPGWEGVGPAGW